MAKLVTLPDSIKEVTQKMHKCTKTNIKGQHFDLSFCPKIIILCHVVTLEYAPKYKLHKICMSLYFYC